MSDKKDDIMHVRVSPHKKEKLIEYAKELTEKDPYMCVDCETRFDEDQAFAYKFKCPYCGGQIKKSAATPSQVMRYESNLLEGIRGYSFYDALVVMCNIGVIDILNIPTENLVNNGFSTLGEALNQIINEDNIKQKLSNIPFDLVLDILYAKKYNNINKVIKLLKIKKEEEGF